MELIYLWVEEYKNIKNEGFNFSSNFVCNYSISNENKVLKIETIKDQISIFSNNINVTAIAGKNGEGKSSILELIAQIFSIESKIDAKYILVTKESEFICNTNINGIKFENQENIDIKEKSNDDNFFIFQSSSFVNGYFDNLIDHFASKLYKSYIDTNIRNQSWLNQFLNGDKILEAYSIKDLRYRNKHSFYNDEFLTTFKNSKLLMQLDLVNKFGLDFFSFNLPNKLTVEIEHNNNTAYTNEDNFYKRVEKSIRNYHEGKINEPDEEYNGVLTENEKKLLTFIQNKYPSTGPTETITLNLNEAIKLLNIYSSIGIKIFNINWYGLSTGQDSFLNLFTLLLHGIESFYEKDKKENQVTNVIIAFDEIENNFHPIWQKKLMLEIVNFINKLSEYYKFKFHLLFSTHSPFIIADLPKEHIIFIENSKQVKPFKKNEQTFGANIHKLMSHGFFMSDKGLMGDFAQYQINKIIENLEMEVPIMTQKELKSRIEMVGEPFLQAKLMEMYIDKFPFEDEIAQLEFENKKLEEKQRKNIKKIEKLKNNKEGK